MEYTYKVIQMQTDDSKASGFVCRAFVELTASNEADSVSYTLKSRFEFDEEQSMIAFSELTESQVIDWVLAENGDKNVNMIKNNLKDLLDAKANQVKSVDLPWS